MRTRDDEYPHVPALCPKFAISAVGPLIEHFDHGPWRDRVVNKMLTRVGLPLDAPWTCAFIQSIGYWSHFQYSENYSLWPIPSSANMCEDLRTYATERNLFVDVPAEGDIALVCDRATGKCLQG